MAKPATPTFTRMVDKFTIGAGCWEWTGAKTGHGYGKVLTYRRTRVAHRVLYELLIGPVPDRMELDRPMGDEAGECVAAEVVSVGWRLKEQTLLKPVVRPVFSALSQDGERIGDLEKIK